MVNSKNNTPHEGGHVHKAYQGIRRMMFHGEIVPGQKISYRDLAERLGMSQTPVIQALKWLEFNRLVCHEPHRGYYTAPIDLQEVGEIYDLREIIELSLLPKIIERFDAAAEKKLAAAVGIHLKAAREVYLYERLEKDMALHLTLAALSGCQVQHQTLENLFDLLYLKYSGSILFSTAMSRADEDHQALYTAISKKDAAVACRLLSSHIRRVKAHVISGLEKSLAAREYTAP